MISKDTIKRTAGSRWSCEDDCFIVESPLFDRVIGTGESVSAPAPRGSPSFPKKLLKNFYGSRAI